VHAWATAGFFAGVGKLGSLKTKVSQRGPGLEFWWGSGQSRHAEADEKL